MAHLQLVELGGLLDLEEDFIALSTDNLDAQSVGVSRSCLVSLLARRPHSGAGSANLRA